MFNKIGFHETYGQEFHNIMFDIGLIVLYSDNFCECNLIVLY